MMQGAGKRAVRVLALAVLPLALFWMVSDRLVFSASASFPTRLWWLSADVPEALQIGDYVAFCPSGKAAELTRQWVPVSPREAGCPGQLPLVVKQILAKPGQEVIIGPDGVAVDSQGMFSSSQSRLRLTEARFMLAADEWFVVASHPRSLDSRLYGPIHRADVRRLAYPLL